MAYKDVFPCCFSRNAGVYEILETCMYLEKDNFLFQKEKKKYSLDMGVWKLGGRGGVVQVSGRWAGCGGGLGINSIH